MTSQNLAGRHVLVTRAIADAGSWVTRLTAEGVRADVMPCVTAERIGDADTLQRLVEAIRSAHCLLVTSVRGAQCVAAAISALPAGLEMAVVGPVTAEAVHRLFGRTPYVAHGGTSRALGGELVALWGAQANRRRVVIAGAEGGRDDADVVLTRAGVHVSRINVYRTIPAPAVGRRRDLAREGTTDVLLASPSAVTGLVNQATVGEAIRLFTIGPTTTAAVKAAGLRIAGEAPTPDLDGLLEAMRCVTGP